MSVFHSFIIFLNSLASLAGASWPTDKNNPTLTNPERGAPSSPSSLIVWLIWLYSDLIKANAHPYQQEEHGGKSRQPCPVMRREFHCIDD